MLLLALLTALAAPPGDPARGEMLAGFAGCIACHTVEDGPTAGGGYAIETEMGRYYGSNLTPHDTGLGGWTFDDFVRAMRIGKAPDGRPYYPVFPYPAFTRTTDADLADLWAWLQALEPVDHVVPPHEPARGAKARIRIWLWRLLYFRKVAPPDDLSDPEVHGAYLVEGLGHCGGCHTPRNRYGAPIRRLEHAGTDQPPESAPNITPHPEGIGDWSMGDLVTMLEMGMEPDGDFVGGEMWRVVEEGTGLMTPEEREAIAAYVMSLEGRPDPE